MKFTVEIEQETDGRWTAEITNISGVVVYGETPELAVAKAKALALRVLADRMELSTTETRESQGRQERC